MWHSGRRRQEAGANRREEETEGGGGVENKCTNAKIVHTFFSPFLGVEGSVCAGMQEFVHLQEKFPKPFGGVEGGDKKKKKKVERPTSEENSIPGCSDAVINHPAGMLLFCESAGFSFASLPTFPTMPLDTTGVLPRLVDIWLLVLIFVKTFSFC